MNKYIPVMFLLITVFLLIISLKNVIKYNDNITAEYNKHISDAEEYMKKDILIDAVSEYEAALKMQPDNYDVALTIVDIYEELEIKSSYLKACDNAIKADPAQLEPYIWVADNYIDNFEYTKAYSYLKRAQNNVGEREEISSRIIHILQQYNNVAFAYDDFKGFVFENGKSTGYAVVEKDGMYGLISSDNKDIVKCEYEEIGLYMNNLIPIKKDNEYYYITIEGYKKIVPDDTAEYLGVFNENYGAAKINGKYGYIDKKGEGHNFEYDYAGSFYNGIAPVKKGNKWAVINTSFKNITDFVFDDIVVDEYGFCSTYGVFFARTDEKYYLYNTDGEKISEGFDDVKLFASDEAAAVKSNGKWGFVSKSGEVIIEPEYEDANSFSIGYAPFFDGKKWGCIDENGVVIIEPIFDNMMSFSKNGYSLVEEDNQKRFISIVTYE